MKYINFNIEDNETLYSDIKKYSREDTIEKFYDFKNHLNEIASDGFRYRRLSEDQRSLRNSVLSKKYLDVHYALQELLIELSK